MFFVQRRMMDVCVLALLLAFLSTAGIAQVTTVTLQDGLNAYTGTRDNSIYSDYPNNTDGGGSYIFVGRIRGSGLRRGLISFDLSSLPSSIQILDVTLTLNVARGRNSQVITAHRLTADWGEGTLVGTQGPKEGQGIAAATGDATWSSNHYNVSTWATAGGDYAAAVSGSGTANILSSFNIRGASMVSDVQAWADGTETNNGWILIGDEATQQSAMGIDSRNNSISGVRPELTITYQTVASVPRALWRR